MLYYIHYYASVLWIPRAVHLMHIYSYIKSNAQLNILVEDNMKISLCLIFISTFVFSPDPITGETLKLHFHVNR